MSHNRATRNRDRATTFNCYLRSLTAITILFAVTLSLSAPAVTQTLNRVDTPGQNAGAHNPRQSAATQRVEMFAGREVAPGEVLIKFRDMKGVSRRAAAQRLAQVVRAADAGRVEEVGGAGTLLIESRSKNTTTLIAELSSRPDVLYAEPNYILRADALPNDPRFDELWGLHNPGQSLPLPGTPGADIKALAAWEFSTGSADNVVGIVDTGIDYNHPDLRANMWSAPAAFTVRIGGRTLRCEAGTHGFDAITNTCDPMDDQNHGTHVAGTIGAVGNNGTGVVGVNQTASMMGLKFLNASGRGTVEDAINAIEFAIQAKAAFAETGGANVRVLNNSWGGDGFSQALLDAINRANQSDMLFVAAAGNDSIDNDLKPHYPSNYDAPNLISVAATNRRDERAWFSNYGRESVHLGAPGEGVLSTTIGNTYQSFNGTSMATPHVAGAAALVLSNCATDTARLKEILLGSVDQIPSMAGVTTTGGRLNVAAALNSCTQPYYSLAAAPSEQTVLVGGGNSVAVTVNPFRGFTGTVAFSAGEVPEGVRVSFEPPAVTVADTPQSTSMTVSAEAGTLPGPHRLTVVGIGGNQRRSTAVLIRVPGYAVTDLGALPNDGERASQASGINNAGQAVGYSLASGYNSDHAFLYSDGRMRDLGTLGGYFSFSRAYGISNASHVVGYSVTKRGDYRAFLYSGGAMQEIRPLRGHQESYAYGVNDAGQVVGYSSSTLRGERAFLYSGRVMQDLGTLGGSTSRAAAINNSGQVVGYSETTSVYNYHAFLYSGGVMQDLGTFGGDDSTASYATDINDAVQVVGFAKKGYFYDHAFLFADGVMHDLGTLGSNTYSYAKGINNAGHVVGYSSKYEDALTGDDKLAFLYRQGRMLNLNDAILPDAGWVLLEAASINDSGQIVGTGRKGGDRRAFLLTPLAR